MPPQGPPEMNGTSPIDSSAASFHARLPAVSAPAGRALGWRGFAQIVLFGGSLLFALSASGKAFNYHEARYAQGAREMLEHGSWLVPTIGERPRLQKPPLVYWSMAAAMAAFGSSASGPRGCRASPPP